MRSARQMYQTRRMTFRLGFITIARGIDRLYHNRQVRLRRPSTTELSVIIVLAENQYVPLCLTGAAQNDNDILVRFLQGHLSSANVFNDENQPFSLLV